MKEKIEYTFDDELFELYYRQAFGLDPKDHPYFKGSDDEKQLAWEMLMYIHNELMDEVCVAPQIEDDYFKESLIDNLNIEDDPDYYFDDFYEGDYDLYDDKIEIDEEEYDYWSYNEDADDKDDDKIYTFGDLLADMIKQKEENADSAFRKLITQTIDAGAGDFKTAIRWIIQGIDDMEEFAKQGYCVLEDEYEISLAFEDEITPIINEMVAEYKEMMA